MNTNDIAQKLAGNWRKFDSFGWYSQPDDDPDLWGIYYTHNRDSGLLAQSNAVAIDAILSKYCGEDGGGNCASENHEHWACGWVRGYSVKVYTSQEARRDDMLPDELRYTPAFLALADVITRLDDYPLLDEEDYSQREYDSALEGIRQCAQFDLGHILSEDQEKQVDLLPEDWETETFSWFWDNAQGEVENRDDTGAYPSPEGLKRALIALGYLKEEK